MKKLQKMPDFIQLEKEVLDFWNTEKLFDKLSAKNKQNKQHFGFVDGPITANNPMGVHHAWGRTLKDVSLKYHALKGFRNNYQNGFDCQGLWVEVEVEKELGFNSKVDIDNYGLDNFSLKCKERVNKFAEIITDQSKRLGQLMDWDNSYYTHSDNNIEHIWRFLSVCNEKGWLYKSHRPMPWCVRCGTSLSEHEMSGSYKDMTHTSVFAFATLKNEPLRNLIIWTTTPWTLPANTAIAVNPEMTYIEVSFGDEKSYILAKDLKKILHGTNAKILKEFSGADLVGKQYIPLIKNLSPLYDSIERFVVPWNDVTSTDGTGLVHIAPGCGAEDHALGKQLNLAEIYPVDDSGKYFDYMGSRLQGVNANNANDLIFSLLKESGSLWRTEEYNHSYPVCWRCKDPLIYRAVSEWFISVDELRPQLIAAAEEIEWQPSYLNKRMKDWLNNMGDWCISRKRYWGLPLPFYSCDCGHTEVVSCKDRLIELSDEPSRASSVQELHRPWIDDITITCPSCQASGIKRVVEVGDCWLDAGIVPYSTDAMPVEWVCEMKEQVRLWFYSMLFMGTVLDGKSPYKRVTAYEKVVDETGKKFSKTGYMIRFDDAVEQIGADPMRYLFCRQPITSDVRFSFDAGNDMKKRLLSYWNSYAFFNTYASIDNPNYSSDFSSVKLTELDHWILSRTKTVIDECDKLYRDFDVSKVTTKLESLLDDLSNFYIRLNRRRFWRGEMDTNKLGAYNTLYTVLKAITIMLSPICPFITDAVWRDLALNSSEVNVPESVHLSDWPSFSECNIVDNCSKVSEVRDIISSGMQLRNSAKIRVKQPLNTLYISTDIEHLSDFTHLIKSELNVNDIKQLTPEEYCKIVNCKVKLNFTTAGSFFKSRINEVKNILASSPEKVFISGDGVLIPGFDNALSKSLFVFEEVANDGFVYASDQKLSIALDVRIDEKLESAGLYRDLVRSIQIMRQESGFNIEDRISITIKCKSEKLLGILSDQYYLTMLTEELLAVSVNIFDQEVSSNYIDINGHSVDVEIAVM